MKLIDPFNAYDIERRLEQAKFIKNHLRLKCERQTYRQCPIIIGGDFKEEMTSQAIDEVMKSYFVDTFEEIYSNNQGLKMEYWPMFTSNYSNKTENPSDKVRKHTNYMFFADNEYNRKHKCAVRQFLNPQSMLWDSQLNDEECYPCRDHPSHHLSVMMEFIQKAEENVEKEWIGQQSVET